MYSIYVHTTPDGKKYVGSTSQEPNKRYIGGSNYRNNTRFYNAIKFFGWNNIQHQVIETVEDKETALKREEYYTLLWRTNEPEFGYNIYVGNIKDEETKKKHSEKMKGIKKSEETKKRISEKMKGIKKSEETKKRISEKVNEYYKKNEFPEDVKKKISESLKEFYKNKVFSEEEIKQRIENSIKHVRLKNIKTGEIMNFYSQRSCAEFFGISNASVHNFINCKSTCKVFKDYEVLK